MMAHANKQIVRHFYDLVWNGHDAEASRQLLDPQVVCEDIGLSEPLRGVDACVRTYQMYLSAFPDVKVQVLQQLEEGDSVATLFQVTATHKGPFLGQAATNRRCTFDCVEIDQIRNGKLVRSKIVWDLAGMARQLGLTLTPEMVQRPTVQPRA